MKKAIQMEESQYLELSRLAKVDLEKYVRPLNEYGRISQIDSKRMKNSDRIPVIDFRGLSCLGVLLYHEVDLWIGWWRITSYPQEYSSFAKSYGLVSIPTHSWDMLLSSSF